MNILFLTRLYHPHIGGVEKHVLEVAKILSKKHKVSVISIKEINPPKVKYIGLLYIWFWMIKNRKKFEGAEVVHVHDVALWYLPLKFLFPNKPLYSTFHGWERQYPIPFKNIFLRRLSASISNKTILVGEYLQKYFGIHGDLVIYGGVTLPKGKITKIKNTALFLGRLDNDTSVEEFIKWASFKKLKITFCGEGSLRPECEKVGDVLGFTDPRKYLASSEYCWASGYLSAMEGMAYKCKVKVGWNSPIRRDIWQMTPFYKFIKNENTEGAYEWVKTQTWNNILKEYLKVWKDVQ